MAWHCSSSSNSKKSPSLLSVESADKVLAKALGVLESHAAPKRTVRGIYNCYTPEQRAEIGNYAGKLSYQCSKLRYTAAEG